MMGEGTLKFSVHSVLDTFIIQIVQNRSMIIKKQSMLIYNIDKYICNCQ